MKILQTKKLVALSLAVILGGCGAGGQGPSGTGNASQAALVAATPVFAGMYDGDGLNNRNNAASSCPAVASTDAPQTISWGKDMLLVSSRNIAYRVCGFRLWTGPISGAVSFNVSTPGSPGSGTGQASLDYYLASGQAKSQTSTFAGNIVTVGANDPSAGSLDFKDAANNTFKFSRIGTSARVVTTSYATFAGVYRQVDWSVFGSTTQPLNDTLSVTAAGTVTAVTPVGTMAGQITKFDANYGVHDVELTVTPRSGPVFTMTGVIGPGPTTSGSANDFGNVTLALTGNNQFYASVFRKP
jgi:hypothetical protein